MKRIILNLSASNKPSGAGRYAQVRTATPTAVEADLDELEEFEEDMLEKRTIEERAERLKKLGKGEDKKKKKKDDDADEDDDEDADKDADEDGDGEDIDEDEDEDEEW